jgi:hypothetical protein
MHTELKGWGTSLWGINEFGVRATTGGPLVIFTDPSRDQQDVLEDAFITVKFFDPTYNLNTGHIAITIDGILAYDGAVGFAAGYVGKVSSAAGVLTVRLRSLIGFEFEKTINASAYAEDLTGLTVLNNWAFKIRSNPAYGTLQPLPIEIALQTPFTTFISLEPYRTLLLASALRIGDVSIANNANKAARVIYQTAFATELHTLLNTYSLRDNAALNVIIAEKQNTRLLDQVLTANSKTLKTDILAFHKLSGLDTAYLSAFNDYLDSSLYIYRVSLVANILLYAKAYELAQG